MAVTRPSTIAAAAAVVVAQNVPQKSAFCHLHLSPAGSAAATHNSSAVQVEYQVVVWPTAADPPHQVYKNKNADDAIQRPCTSSATGAVRGLYARKKILERARRAGGPDCTMFSCFNE